MTARFGLVSCRTLNLWASHMHHVAGLALHSAQSRSLAINLWSVLVIAEEKSSSAETIVLPGRGLSA